MSQRSSHSVRPPDVDATEMLERKRLEAELFSLDGQVRSFGRIRDRLTAAGKDPSAYYRELATRREKLVAALKQHGSGTALPSVADPRPAAGRIDAPLLALPIAPARFDPTTGVFGFGTSGVVQAAPAADNTNVVAQGPFPHSGEIVSVPGGYPGVVIFKGLLHVGPDQIPTDDYDPTLNYFWIRSWKYLIPFPPPSVDSRLTYRFEASALFSIFFGGGEANVMSFVTLGETPGLTTGTNVPVGIDGGWPVIADLKEPRPQYNGHYGNVAGRVTVQRSFMVAGGRVPGVAVVVGAIGALSMMSQVNLFFGGIGESSISIRSEAGGGRVEYSYEPQLVMSPG
jgi:hypothetical protein